MTLDQTLQALVTLLLDIRNSTRDPGTQPITLIDLFPPSPLEQPASASGNSAGADGK